MAYYTRTRNFPRLLVNPKSLNSHTVQLVLVKPPKKQSLLPRTILNYSATPHLSVN